MLEYDFDAQVRMQPPRAQFSAEMTPAMRSVLVSWLSEVTDALDMSPSVFHLGVRYLDTCLATVAPTAETLQTLGAACLWIATKFELGRQVPLEAFMRLMPKECTVKLLCAMERRVLATLGFTLAVPTAHDFCEYVLEYGEHSLGERRRAAFYLEIAMLAYEPFQCELPSVLAAAALNLAGATVLAADLACRDPGDAAEIWLCTLVLARWYGDLCKHPAVDQPFAFEKYADVRRELARPAALEQLASPRCSLYMQKK